MNRFIFWTSLLSVYALTWIILNNLYLHTDVSWLLRASTLAMHGGTYTNDFFSANPPATLYFYRPPVIWAEKFHTDLIVTFRLYIYLIISLSLFMCHQLSKTLLKNMTDIVIMAMAISFMILPLQEFGQRDVLLYIMAMPYLLLVCWRANAIPIKTSHALIIGFFIGLALAMKPHFFTLPLIIELWLMIKTKRLFAWFRPEIGMICFVFVGYLALTITYYPDFMTVILPIILKHYDNNVRLPLSLLLQQRTILFCLLPIFIYFATYPFNANKSLINTLTLALVSYLLIYLAQGSIFPHHLVLPFAMGFFLLSLQMITIAPNQNTKMVFFCLILPTLYALLIHLNHNRDIWTILIFSPGLFFAFLATILVACLSRYMSLTKTIISAFLVTLISYITYYMTVRDSLHAYTFAFTLLALLSTLLLLAPKKHYFFIVMTLVFFSMPGYVIHKLYDIGVSERFALNTLIEFSHAHPQYKSIYAIAYSNISNPLMHYNHLTSASRFDCMWPTYHLHMRGLLTFKTDRSFDVISMVAEDIEKHRPDIIVVESSRTPPNFLDYFLLNDRFKEQWRHYRYLTSLSLHYRPKLNIYEYIKE